MKKIVALILTFLSCGTIHALPAGNPAEASLLHEGVWMGTACCNPCDPCFYWFDAWSVRAGFYGDYVFNRNLEADERKNHRDIEKTEIYTNAGYLVLNVCDRIDVFGTLGATSIKIYSHEQPFQPGPTIGTDIFHLYYNTTFSWSVGARGTLLKIDCFRIGASGQWFETCPKLDYIDETRLGEHTYFDGIHSRYQEWQASLGISYTFRTICPTFEWVPYAAVTWAGVKWKTDELPLTTFDGREFQLRDLRNQKLWGYALGVSFSMVDMIAFTVEGRFADEKALYVNGQVRF